VSDGRKYGCIYADPPWRYSNQATRSATDGHYGSMTLEQLLALPVIDLASTNSHLHLWTTSSFLPDAINLLASTLEETMRSDHCPCCDLKHRLMSDDYQRIELRASSAAP
jgi:hypothetical protein